MSEAAYFPESWPLIFDFLTFFIRFYVGSGSKYGTGTESVVHSGSGSAKAKSYGSCGSGTNRYVKHAAITPPEHHLEVLVKIVK
jgi:hypothetical protein